VAEPEVYLPDERVLPIQEQLYQKYPIFIDWHTDFVTVRHEPPYTGNLPDGSQGVSQEAIIQFMIVSDYPATRPIQRAAGVRHGSQATTYERGWLEAEQEFKSGHYVGQGKDDPLMVIFQGLAYKHFDEVMSLAQIMN
jgi:hypothetical protein